MPLRRDRTGILSTLTNYDYSLHVCNSVTPPPSPSTLPVCPPFTPPMYCHHRAVSVTVCPLWFCNHHTACPGMIHGPLPRLARRGRDPALLVVPGTGAPSPRPHCSPPLAALHPHPLTPSMPSPRSQLSHTARYPTATHHPSKSGSICVSQFAQCDVMLSTPHFPFTWPPVSARCLHGWANAWDPVFYLSWCVLLKPICAVQAEDSSVVFWHCSDFSMFGSSCIQYIAHLILQALTQSACDAVCPIWLKTCGPLQIWTHCSLLCLLLAL